MEPVVAPFPPSLIAPGVDPEAFEPMLAIEDLPHGAMRRVSAGDLDILLAHTTDGIVATDDRCPHMSAPLSIGELDGCVVACPLHEGRFNLRSGNPERMPTTGGLDPEGVYHPTWTPGGREPKTDPPGKKAEARRLTRVRRFRYYPVRLREGAIWVALPVSATPIVVVDYDPSWARLFEQIRATVAAALDDVTAAIEHVGSTSVPGLAAKPIVDVDVVVESDRDVAVAINRLSRLGYVHLGPLGIAGREAFRSPTGSAAHNLYVCRAGSLGVRNHLALRDHLRTHPDSMEAYGALKRQLADALLDIDAYTEAKTELIVGILAAEGFSADEIEAIRVANRARD
jgi:GrpB-like predicted nucleotidyltransferase (UPF0157 family)